MSSKDHRIRIFQEKTEENIKIFFFYKKTKMQKENSDTELL